MEALQAQVPDSNRYIFIIADDQPDPEITLAALPKGILDRACALQIVAIDELPNKVATS